MAQTLFPDVGKIEFVPTGDDFDSSEDVIAVENLQIVHDTSEFPEPEPRMAPIGANENGKIGETISADLRLVRMAAEDVDALRAAGVALHGYDVRFTSKDGRVQATVEDVLLSVTSAPIVKGDVYGYTRIQFTKTTTGDVQALPFTVVSP